MGCSQILSVGTHGLHVDLSLIRLVDMGFNGMFPDPLCRYTVLHVDLSLIRLMDMGFNGMFSYPHCGHTEPLGGPVFNQIGGPWFQWDVLKSSLKVYRG